MEARLAQLSISELAVRHLPVLVPVKDRLCCPVSSSGFASL